MLNKYIVSTILLVSFFAASLLRFSTDLLILYLICLLITAAFMFFIVDENGISADPYLLACLGAFFLIAFIGMFYSPDIYTARNSLFVYLFAFLYAVMADSAKLSFHNTALKLPVIISAWFGVVLVTTYLMNPVSQIMNDILPHFLIVNYNLPAAFMCFSLPLAMVFSENRAFNTVLMQAIFAGIVLSRSRTAIIIALFVYCYWLYKYSIVPRKVINVLIASSAVLIIVISYLKFQRYPIEGSLILPGRLQWWSTALQIFTISPIFGSGLGSYETLSNVYRSAASQNTLYPHNIILQLLVETGIAGLTLFLAAIVLAVRNILKGEDRRKAAALALAITAYFINELFSYSSNFLPFMMMFFTAAFWPAGKSVEFSPFRNNIARCLMVIVSIGGIFYLSSLSAAQVFWYQGNSLLKTELYKDSENKFKEALKLDPLPSGIYSAYSQFYFTEYKHEKKEDSLNKSILYLNKAIKRSPAKASYHSDMAWLYMTKGNKKLALEYMKEALRLDKHNKIISESLIYMIRT